MPLNGAGWSSARKALTSAFGRPVDVGFVHEVLRATGGGASLVRALAEDLAASGVVPESAHRAAVATTAGPRLARAVARLAGRLDPELLPAVLLLCVGGDVLPYAWLAGLADVPRTTLDRGVRVLAEFGFLEGGPGRVRFRHAPSRRLFAARVLEQLVEPARWTTLQTQMLYLFEGPPDTPPRSLDPLILARLYAAVRRRLDVRSRVLLAEQLCWVGQGDAALSLLRGPWPAGTDTTAVCGMRTMICCFYPGELGSPPAPPAGTWTGMNDSPPLTVAAEALSAALNGMPSYEIAPRAEWALAALELNPGTFHGALSALWALLYADRLESAAVWSRRLAQGSRRCGGVAWQSMFLTIQATVERQLGALKASARHNALALDLAAEKFATAPWRVVIEWSRLMATLLHDSDAGELVAVEPPPTSVLWVYHRHARGREHLAAGRHDEAYSAFMACGNALRSWRMDNPTVVPWRSQAALALAATGNRAAGLAFSLEEVRLARACAAPRVLGISLRTAAELADPPFRLDLLRESALVHENVGARLEQAYTLFEIGVEQLRAADGRQGRATLADALRLAEECSDADLGNRIRRHLSNAGDESSGRVGAAALTASQRRVALLAMAGRSNREIAGELFLTVSTVEQHLTQIYRKLGITRRAELTRLAPEALAPGDRGRSADLRVAPSRAAAEE